MTTYICYKMLSSFEEDNLLIPKSGTVSFYQPFDYHIDNGIAIMVLTKINDFNLTEDESTHIVKFLCTNNLVS